MTLPIAAILDDLIASLDNVPNAVLIAPPGAGKTTSVAPALLGRNWNKGQILLLSPRRLATRTAAYYIAQKLNEEVGKTIGYVTRNDSKQSRDNKILVMTEGIFRNKIIEDPLLEGVSAVLFDEVHERSLDNDFGLALALETQQVFRPDLRLIAMSATLDGDRFATIMEQDNISTPIFESAGKSYPLHIHHIGRKIEHDIEQDIASCVRMTLHEHVGDILIFLPGIREIKRLYDILPQSDDIIIHKLHGAIDPKQQREALRPDEQKRRKIILATNIAETSLTIDGVRIVIDSGLVRRARYDRSANVTRLVTEKSSLASSLQRAGRAARQGVGHAFRLWDEAANGGLPPFDPPEILECDLSSLLLDCAVWGEYDPQNLAWLDRPPQAGLDQALKQLKQLTIFDDSGRITEIGKLVAQMPLPPHLGYMMLCGAQNGLGMQSAMIALLLQEHALGGRNIDLEERLQHIQNDKNARTKSALKMAQSWAGRSQKLSQNITQITEPINSVTSMLALAFPDRVAKRQDGNGEAWLGAGGRRYYLDREKAAGLASRDWIVIADVQGSASKARIISAMAIDIVQVEALFSNKIVEKVRALHDVKTDRVDAGYIRSLGAIILAKGDSDKIEPEMIARALLDSVKANDLAVLPWSKASHALRRRALYAGEDVISDDRLMKDIEDWLLPLLQDKRRIAHINEIELHQALETKLGWDALQKVNKIAPSHYNSSEGRYMIDYDVEVGTGPNVTLRVQALFGVSEHPMIGQIPLTLSLTSPAGRPIQTTCNLPEFWQGSWHEVAKEMRGRYPKHHWPDDPMNAKASLKTKKRQNLK